MILSPPDLDAEAAALAAVLAPSLARKPTMTTAYKPTPRGVLNPDQAKALRCGHAARRAGFCRDANPYRTDGPHNDTWDRAWAAEDRLIWQKQTTIV